MRKGRKRKHRVLRHLLFQGIVREKGAAGRRKTSPGNLSPLKCVVNSFTDASLYVLT